MRFKGANVATGVRHIGTRLADLIERETAIVARIKCWATGQGRHCRSLSAIVQHRAEHGVQRVGRPAEQVLITPSKAPILRPDQVVALGNKGAVQVRTGATQVRSDQTVVQRGIGAGVVDAAAARAAAHARAEAASGGVSCERVLEQGQCTRVVKASAVCAAAVNAAASAAAVGGVS